jgi:hypothetical protein
VSTAAEHTPEERRRFLPRLLRWNVLSGIGAAVALAAAGVGLGFDLHPGWRPDPGVMLSGELHVLAYERGVTYGSYLRRVGDWDTLRKTPSPVRQVTGPLYYVEVHGQGLKDQEPRLLAYLYDGKTKKRLRYRGPGSQGLKLGTTNDRFVTAAWVQPPADRGKYFLRVELRVGGTLLAIADTPVFRECRRGEGCGA